MDFNTGGTCYWVRQWTLMMKIYDFFIRLSRLVAQYNNIKKSSPRWKIFDILLYRATNQLSRIKTNHKFSSLVFIARPDVKCLQCQNPFSYFGLWYLIYIPIYNIQNLWNKTYHNKYKQCNKNKVFFFAFSILWKYHIWSSGRSVL